MKVVALLLCAGVAHAFVPNSNIGARVSVVRPAEVDDYIVETQKAEFAEWKTSFKKSYSSEDEEATAYSNFVKNWKLSKKMNAILKQPATSLNANADQALGGSAPAPAAAAPKPAAAPATASVKDRYGPGDSPVKELALVGAAPWGVFDPLNIADEDDMSRLLWYRAAELKHGRVCMLAFTGWWVQVACGVTFKGFLSPEEKLTFDDVAKVEWFADSWEKIPVGGQAQILTLIGAVEWYTEVTIPRSQRGTRSL